MTILSEQESQGGEDVRVVVSDERTRGLLVMEWGSGRGGSLKGYHGSSPLVEIKYLQYEISYCVREQRDANDADVVPWDFVS